jgi:pyridoxal phosphate enzyme (YggS family)
MTFETLIKENVSYIRDRMAIAARTAGRSGGDILLVAASKTHPVEAVRAAITAGVDAVGENKVQELLEKNDQDAYLGAPLHFIGHLQTNKVKQVTGVADLIQSVDSAKLLHFISGRASEMGIVQDVLLEINIAGEESKTGMSPELLPQVLDAAAALTGIRVRGLMSIPPVSLNSGDNRPYFASMFKLFIDNKAKKYDNVSMDFLSMGMSGDFEDAILEGSNMIRVGSAIFGAREYKTNIS